jgi:hypothetical protein
LSYREDAVQISRPPGGGESEAGFYVGTGGGEIEVEAPILG